MTSPILNPLDDRSATRIAAGGLEAVFLPTHGMLGIALRDQGIEYLRRIDHLKEYAAKNRTAGLPFLFPWANRLDGFQYQVAGRGVTLSAHSPVLRYDENGLPMHGMMWPHLSWTVTEATSDTLTATFEWSHPRCLTLFPYPCRLTMTAAAAPGSLTVETTLASTGDTPVPISFGFHPYLGLPCIPRGDWHISLPAMRHLTLDDRKIPTGASEPYPGLDDPICDRTFDDGFALIENGATLTIAAGGRSLSVDLLQGYSYTQVFLPPGEDYLAFEPMTAPANALVSGEGLRFVAPGETFKAKFRFRIENAAKETG